MLYHYKARVYDPKLGRFLQTDPVGYEDQVNLYTYVANDPLTNTDPTGKFIHMVIGAAIGAALDAGIQAYNNHQSGQSLEDSIKNIDLGSVAVSAALGASGAVGSQLIKGAVTGTLKVGSQSVALASGTERAVVGTLGVANASATGTAIAGVKGKDLSTGAAVQVANGVAPGLGSGAEFVADKMLNSQESDSSSNNNVQEKRMKICDIQEILVHRFNKPRNSVLCVEKDAIKLIALSWCCWNSASFFRYKGDFGR